MLLNADINDIKENLANFIVHNLYNNINNDVQIIYIITLILKKEIKNLNNNETCCGTILKELSKKKELKFFFKTIFFDIFKKLETSYSSIDLNLNIEDIEKIIEIKNFKNNKIIDDKIQVELVKNNYINKEMSLEALNNILEKCQTGEMKFFIDKLKLELSKDKDIYSIKNFLEIIETNKENSDKIINYYISSFIQITDIINIFFENLIKNVDMMPYSIKCICKIIYILINKHLNALPSIEKLAYFNIFFFDVILLDILEEPSSNTFLNEFIISESTKNKMKIFQEILYKIFYGELFRKTDFIPFNFYIIEKFSYVIEFQKKLINLKLPGFIDKIINDEEFENNYEYNYFKENPEENILYRNICFNINELCSIISNAEKCKKDLNISEKILEKFRISEYINKLEKLKSDEEFDLNSQETSNLNFSEPTKVIKCYLLYDVVINKTEKMKNINKYEKYKKEYFNPNEIKEEDEFENIIIKIKNLLCGLLFHSEYLSKNNFTQVNLLDITSILKSIQNISMVNSKISLDYNYVPLNWYINCLFQNMNKIKIALDFPKILNELEESISNSIKSIPFEDLDIFIEYHETIKREKMLYEKIKNILKEININIKVGNIIKNECIVIDLNVELSNLKDSERKQYEFIQDLINRRDKYHNIYINQEYNNYYNTIQHFINNFPDISIFQNLEIDNFKLISDEHVPEIIDSYLFFLKKNLFSKGIVDDSNINDIFNKIYDYIFEYLYLKLSPKEQLIEDIKIFQNCYKHQWIEPKHLFKEEKNYVIENFLPESINYLQKFEEEKSPRKKMENLKKIFEFLYKVGNFSNDQVELVDDELSLLTLIIVKSLPLKLFSNCKFCELFHAKGGFMNNILTKFLLLCEKLKKNLSENDFYHINKNEYEYNIKNNIINKNNE